MPAAAAAIDAWRERTCGAKPSSGLPPHVTLAFPFVPPPVGKAVVDELVALFGAVLPFSFELRSLGRFPRVLYLAPEPRPAFVALHDRVQERLPGYALCGEPTWTFVPHVTVAEGDDDVLAAAEAAVSEAVPLAADATEVWLVEEAEPDRRRWRVRVKLPLGWRTGA